MNVLTDVSNPNQRCPNRYHSNRCTGWVRLPYNYCLMCLVGFGFLNQDGSRRLEAAPESKHPRRQGGMANRFTVPPPHYNAHPSGVECIEITRHLGFNLGNVVKYVWRMGLKENESEIKDLEKALDYLNDEITKRKLALGAVPEDTRGKLDIGPETYTRFGQERAAFREALNSGPQRERCKSAAEIELEHAALVKRTTPVYGPDGKGNL